MKRLWSVLQHVLIWLLAIDILFVLLVSVATGFLMDRSQWNLWGFKLQSVQTEEMGADYFSVGDLVILKDIPVQSGDLVFYYSAEPESYGELQLGTVEAVSEDMIQLSGGKETEASLVIGQCWRYLPQGGSFAGWLRTTVGFWIGIVLPMVLLLALLSYRGIGKLCRDRNAWKQEQAAAEAEELRQAQLREACDGKEQTETEKV